MVVVLRLGEVWFAQDSWDQLVKKHGVTIVGSNAASRDEFVEQLKAGKYAEVECIARTPVSVKQTGLYDKELIGLLKKYTKLKSISHQGAGYDHIDATACAEAGIQVSNTPDVIVGATANTNVFLIISALRCFQHSAEIMRTHQWPVVQFGLPIGHEPEGKVLGILGMGGIGRSVRDKTKPFGISRVLYYNRHRLPPDLEKDSEYCADVADLFRQSDIISINVPLTKETKYMVDKRAIDQMKHGVVIVNTARGAIVKETDLIPALRSGQVGAFGSDVFENEPNINPEFFKLPNVTALPHMGTHTVETKKTMEDAVEKNVEHYIETGTVASLVPECRKLL